MAGKDFEWFVSADLGRYKRKHIAILQVVKTCKAPRSRRLQRVVNRKVVASGDNAKKVWEMAKKKHPDKEPLMAKVPDDELLIL